MCLVYKAVHLGRGEAVALKLLVPEEPTSLAMHARFLGVAQSVARLRSDHLARIVDIGVLPDGVPYVASELPTGIDLASEIAQRGVLPPGATVDVVLQICEALAEAHAAGIVHHAITPQRVLLTVRPDGSSVAKLLDLGMAPVSPAVVSGKAESVDYLAPEQLAGGDDRDPRSDVWALGIVLYECLTGVRPFAAESLARAARKIASEPPPPLDPRLPRELQAIVMRCLEKSRDARFASVDGLAAALAPFAHQAGRGAMLAARAIVVAQGKTAGQAPPSLSMIPVTAVSAALPAVSPARRYATITGVALAVSVGGLAAAAALFGDDRSRDATARPATAAASMIAADSAPGAAGRPAGAPATGAAVLAPLSPDPADAQARTLALCSELRAHEQWQALDVCAGELAGLGAAERAEPFHVAARQALQRETVRQALRAGQLAEARIAIDQLGADTPGAAELRDRLATAERERAQAVRSQAEALAAAHDCSALRALVGQLAATTTEPVAAAARGVPCAEPVVRTAPAGSPPSPRPGAGASPSPRASAAAPPSVTPRASAAAPPSVTSRAGAAAPPSVTSRAGAAAPPSIASRAGAAAPLSVTPRASAAAPPSVTGRASASPSVTGRPGAPPGARPSSCDTLDVNRVMTRAAIQYDSGAAASALALTRSALACKQTDRMYWLAVMYACAARDVTAARLYFSRVPANLQSGVERKCQQENLDVRSR